MAYIYPRTSNFMRNINLFDENMREGEPQPEQPSAVFPRSEASRLTTESAAPNPAQPSASAPAPSRPPNSLVGRSGKQLAVEGNVDRLNIPSLGSNIARLNDRLSSIPREVSEYRTNAGNRLNDRTASTEAYNRIREAYRSSGRINADTAASTIPGMRLAPRPASEVEAHKPTVASEPIKMPEITSRSEILNELERGRMGRYTPGMRQLDENILGRSKNHFDRVREIVSKTGQVNEMLKTQYEKAYKDLTEATARNDTAEIQRNKELLSGLRDDIIKNANDMSKISREMLAVKFPGGVTNESVKELSRRAGRAQPGDNLERNAASRFINTHIPANLRDRAMRGPSRSEITQILGDLSNLSEGVDIPPERRKAIFDMMTGAWSGRDPNDFYDAGEIKAIGDVNRTLGTASSGIPTAPQGDYSRWVGSANDLYNQMIMTLKDNIIKKYLQ
jgi:hypothetical protein